MKSAKQVARFLGLAALTVGSAHYYIYVRFSHYLGLEGALRYLAFFILFTLFALEIGSLMAIRRLPRRYATPLAWTAFSWMGISMLAFVGFILADVLTLLSGGFQLATGFQTETFDRVIGLAAIAVIGGASVIALLNAHRGTAVRAVDITLKSLPPSLDGFTVAQLTDLHIGPTLNGAWLRHVVARTNELKADIIVITGDLVDGSVEELAEHVAPLKDLTARYGVYFVTGNHEYYSGVNQWIAYIKTLGIRVLRNETVMITPDNQTDTLEIIGIDDYASRGYPGHGPDLTRAMRGHVSGRTTILLAHQPAAVIEAAEKGIDLQLSGHTHGGQIWPFNYTVKLQQPYVSGLHRHLVSDTQVYISRGTGYWGPPMRLGAPAEITHITLKSEQ